MSSSILPFRSWVAAALAVLVIELAILFTAHPNIFDRTNFLQFSFVKDETPQRLFVWEKIKAFADSNPTILQSGDSSGFYGIEPNAVMKHLPAGVSYLNMSCCANLGFRGYYNIMELMAERNPSIKYMVLHFTPYTMPRPELWDSDGAALWGIADVKVFGDAVHQEFLSLWRLFHLPSLTYRRQVTDYAYYAAGRFNDPNRPLLNNANYLEFHRTFRQTHGWMPESDARRPVATSECDIPTPDFFSVRDMGRKTYLQDVLDSYTALARRHRATLVIVFQPVACTLGTGRGSEKARAVINQFKHDNPDVEIPFPLIETWPADIFTSEPAHVRREHTDQLADRLGPAMAEIIKRRGL
ncbi:hypothetical protein [Bradyrhizobium liaoningense]|uniref:hypothetical protein n=1 Tax=Bradyrhizobium liaoningense TaxID=43992 RepID=UPI001BABD470|nr:hypothetical protein [Bradyrhizobium liaoningense]MBR0855682.1 hypothetical protein [Bradyrhizobium liaoningense]